MSRKLEELREKYSVTVKSAELIGRMDPTANQKYVDWLFKVRYVHVGNQKYRVVENFPSTRENEVRDALEWFERNLNGKIPSDFRDINKFKNLDEFIEKVSDLKTPSRSEIKNNVRVVFEDESWKIVIPLSFEASKLYGTGTRWCTTQKTYYDNYMRDGLLYYIIDKRINRKFGLPIPSNRGINVTVNNFTLYNNEDCGLNINQVKLIYGTTIDSVLEKVRVDFTQQLKIKLRLKYLEDSKKTISNTVKMLKSVDMTNDEVNEMLCSLMKEMGLTK